MAISFGTSCSLERLPPRICACLSMPVADPQADIWKTYFSNPTERNVKDIDANKSNLRLPLGSLQVSPLDIGCALTADVTFPHLQRDCASITAIS